MGKTPITIVVPCFNEEDAVIALHQSLQNAIQFSLSQYEVHMILVDDGSGDETWSRLRQLFRAGKNWQLIHQPSNQGIAASISNGIRHSTTEIVCSIDCDCTYNPVELSAMLPLLTDDVGLVVASPYHPLGRVDGISKWRLFPSQVASFLYRRILKNKLHTYTSCFRVYRRSAVLDIEVSGGFIGITELVAKLDEKGIRVVECPAILRSRTVGRSKMKFTSVIAAHLRLLMHLATTRIRNNFASPRPEERSEKLKVRSHPEGAKKWAQR